MNVTYNELIECRDLISYIYLKLTNKTPLTDEEVDILDLIEDKILHKKINLGD